MAICKQTKDSKYIVLILVILFILGVNILKAYYVFPPPRTDEVFWLVPIVNNINNNGLIHQFTDYPTYISEQDGAYSITGYPPLHPLLVSFLSFGKSIVSVYIAIGLMNSLGLIFMAASLYYLLKMNSSKPSIKNFIVFLGILFTYAANSFGGRPETTATLVLTILSFIVIAVGNKLSWLTYGLFLGLIGGTTPVAGLLSGFILMCHYSYKYSSRKDLLSRYIASGVVSLVVFFVIISIKYDISNSILSIVKGTPGQIGYWFDFRKFVWHNFLIKEKLFIGLAVIFALLIAIIFPTIKPPKSKFFYIFGCILFFLAYFIFSVARPEPVYNIQAVLPIGMLMAFYLSLEKNILLHLSIVIFCISSAGFVVSTIGFLIYLKCGITYYEAKKNYEIVETILAKTNKAGIDQSIWALENDVRIFNSFYPWYFHGFRHCSENQDSNIYLQQMYSNKYVAGSLSPPKTINDKKECINHVLSFNYFNTKKPTIFGFNYSRTIPGYGFAIYRPLKADR